jgi:uncharacterized membrane protein (DUF4010 family)
VLYARVLIAAAILSPALAWALAPALVAPAVVGVVGALAGSRRATALRAQDGVPARNPLQLRSALEMALLFEVVLVLVDVIGTRFGSSGLLGMAAVVGLTDADALTLSMAQEVGRGALPASIAARAVAVGLLSNTIVKTVLAATAGQGRFRVTTVSALLTMAVALAVAVVALR